MKSFALARHMLWATSLFSLSIQSSSCAAAWSVPSIFRKVPFLSKTLSPSLPTEVISADDLLKGQTMVSVADAIALHTSSSAQNVKFVDGSWFLSDRNGRQEFLSGPRIAGAQYFDIDDIAADSPYLHMMPPKELFAAAMDAMGITNQDHIIVYGTAGCPLVHRAWFQIRNMGHGSERTHLLDGSLDDWKAQGGPIEEGEPSIPMISSRDLVLDEPTKYQAMDPQNVVDKEEMKRIIAQGENADAILVDVRSPERFRGEVEEPRPGMRLGRMPGSKNVFFKDLLNPDNVLQFKSKDEMKEIIAKGGVDIATDKRIIVHCGSGASACALVAALDLCGRDPKNSYVYDGSWSEWGALPDTPIEKDGKLVN